METENQVEDANLEPLSAGLPMANSEFEVNENKNMHMIYKANEDGQNDDDVGLQQEAIQDSQQIKPQPEENKVAARELHAEGQEKLVSDQSNQGFVKIHFIKNFTEEKKELMLKLIKQHLSQGAAGRVELYNAVNLVFGHAWGLSTILTPQSRTILPIFYEYICFSVLDTTYEIYRVQMLQDDLLSKEDLKTICKSSKIDDLLEMQILDCVKKHAMETPNLVARQKKLVEELDKNYGKSWVVSIMNRGQTFQYQFAHPHYRIRILCKGLYYELYKAEVNHTENLNEENFKVILKKEKITQAMVDDILKFMRIAFEKTDRKFDHHRSEIIKQLLDQHYGEYWLVSAFYKASDVSQYYNYFNQQLIKFVYRDIIYVICRQSEIYEDKLNNQITVVQKDKDLDLLVLSKATQLVAEAYQKFPDKSSLYKRAKLIKEQMQNTYGNYWAVIVSKSAGKDYSYFKKSFVRINYKSMMYDIFISSVK